MRRRSLIAIIVSCASLSCACVLCACGDVVYTPAAASVLTGGPLRGAVHIAILDVTGAPPTLHARLDVHNAADETMWLSPARQWLKLDEECLIPAEANTPVPVPPHAERLVDLHFVLPPETRLDSFAVRWQLDHEGKPIAGRVRFESSSIFPTMPCGANADPYCISGYAGGD